MTTERNPGSYPPLVTTIEKRQKQAELDGLRVTAPGEEYKIEALQKGSREGEQKGEKPRPVNKELLPLPPIDRASINRVLKRTGDLYNSAAGEELDFPPIDSK